MNAPIAARSPAGRSMHPATPSLERRRVRIYLAMVVLDVCLILGGFGLVGQTYLDYNPMKFALLQAQLLLPLYLTLALYQWAYSIHALQDRRFAITRALGALALAAALLLFVTFYTKSTAQFSRVVFTGGITVSAGLIVLSRIWLGRLIGRSWGASVINLLYIDAGGPPVSIEHAIRLDAREQGIVPDFDDPDALDHVGRFLLNMDRVVVSCPAEEREAWAYVLRASGVRGELVTDGLGELQPIGLSVEKGWRALIVSTGPLGMRQRVTKRGFDLALSLGGLIVLSPLMLVVALLIKLEDGGPVFFIQRRPGRGNRFFGMYKFRSMKVERTDHDGARSASLDDDRVTRIGRVIRRTSIDELPQLMNVIRGDMSLVGPRPHALEMKVGDRYYQDAVRGYAGRHRVRPGITGLAQVRGLRGEIRTVDRAKRRVELDKQYIDGWSLWLDLRILLATVRAVLFDRDAY